MANQKDQAKERGQAYTTATKYLREAHAEEFQKLYAVELRRRGLELTPSMTKRERDRKRVEEILAANPGLEDEMFYANQTEEESPNA